MDGSPQVVRFDATTLWHFDAAEWAPSTASKADISQCNRHVRFTPHKRTFRSLIGMSISRRLADKLPAFHQSGMPLASKQDRGTSGKSRTQADLSRTWIERMLPGCSQQQGVIDHVRLQPPLCRIASSTRGRQASFDPI